MPTGYQIGAPRQCYFLTLQIVDLVDVFSRQCYRQLILDSLAYCRQRKGLHIYAYVVEQPRPPARSYPRWQPVRHHPRFETPHGQADALLDAPEESRRWIKDRFAFYARNNGATGFIRLG